MPRGPRRNLRPVAASRSQPRASTSTTSWPTDWHASSRNGTPARRVRAPTASAGLTTPPPVGTCVSATRATSSSRRRSSWSRSTWPCCVVLDHLERGAGPLARLQERDRVADVLRARGEDALAGLRAGSTRTRRSRRRSRSAPARSRRAGHRSGGRPSRTRRRPAPRTPPRPRTDRSPPPDAGARRPCPSPRSGAGPRRRCSGGRRARCRACHGEHGRGQSHRSSRPPSLGRPPAACDAQRNVRAREDSRLLECGRLPDVGCRRRPHRGGNRATSCSDVAMGSAGARAPEDDGRAVGCRGRSGGCGTRCG